MFNKNTIADRFFSSARLCMCHYYQVTKWTERKKWSISKYAYKTFWRYRHLHLKTEFRLSVKKKKKEREKSKHKTQQKVKLWDIPEYPKQSPRPGPALPCSLQEKPPFGSTSRLPLISWLCVSLQVSYCLPWRTLFKTSRLHRTVKFIF